MENTLIFDVGAHIGEDSEFYLRKGFNVVAVEANPALCDGLKQRFADEIDDGRFILVDKAIAEQAGSVAFFVNSTTNAYGARSEPNIPN